MDWLKNSCTDQDALMECNQIIFLVYIICFTEFSFYFPRFNHWLYSVPIHM